MSTDTVHARDLTPRQTAISIAIIGVLFFIFGFVSWANAILIPYFKIGCELTYFEAYLVTFAFYISYLLFSLPAAHLLNRTGFKQGMMIGFWVMALGAFIFIPAAMTRTYGIFLGGLFTLGAGLAILQTAANPYITVLGPKETAARRISIMGICNKGAGILAPLLFAAAVFRVTDTDLFNRLATMAAGDLPSDRVARRRGLADVRAASSPAPSHETRRAPRSYPRNPPAATIAQTPPRPPSAHAPRGIRRWTGLGDLASRPRAAPAENGQPSLLRWSWCLPIGRGA